MNIIIDKNNYFYDGALGCRINCEEYGECQKYTGAVPDGYESCEDWFVNCENKNAYKLVNGNLVYDAQRDAELQAQYEVEAERNANASIGYVNDKLNQISSLYDNNLKKITTDLVIDDASEYSIPEMVIESKELYNKDNITREFYPTQDGGTGNYFTWNTTDYMEVIPNEKYCYKGLTNKGNAPYSHYYDENKNFVSSFKQEIGENIITIPSNVRYIRFPVASDEYANHNDVLTFSFKRISYEDGIKLQVSNSNLLTNAGKEESINGLTFIPNEDGTVYIKGTATADTEYILGGSMENTTPLFMFDTIHSIYENIELPFWINPIISVLEGSIENIEGTYVRGKLYSYDGIDRELIAEHSQTELSENKYITCATLFFSSGTVIDATLGLTVRKQDCTGDYIQSKTRGVIDINITELGIDEKIVISGNYIKVIDDEGNEEIVKSILPLMSYEKGENYDYTLIQCNKDLNITTTYYSNIKVGGFNITTNGLEIEIRSNYDYTEEDKEKVNNYLVGLGELTEEEKIKYDVSGDGRIMSNDALLMGYMLDYGITTEQGVKFTINNGEMANMFNFITVKDGNDNVLTKLGLRGITTNGLTVNGNIEADALSVGEINVLERLETNAMTIAFSSHTNIELTQTYTYSTLRFDTIESSYGSKLTYRNGDIVIGAGVKKVRVNANVMNTGPVGTHIFAISHNDKMIATIYPYHCNATPYYSASITSKIIEVEEGDTIQLKIGANVTGTFKIGAKPYSWLTVEVVE